MVAFALGVLATLLAIWLSGPRSYADCMYRMAKSGAEGKLAAFVCSEKFPPRNR